MCLPPQINDLQLLQKPRVPSSLMPFLRQGSLRRTQTRKYLRSIRKVKFAISSINKVVCDLTTILEGNLKDLYGYEEEIKEHMDKRKCDETEVRRKMK